jgi:hypothetical protein
MNYIPGFAFVDPGPATIRHRMHAAALLLVVCGLGSHADAASTPAAPDPLRYRLEYTVTADPAKGTVDVSLEVQQHKALLREMRFSGGTRISNVEGDGDLERSGREYRWHPPVAGGTLRWRVKVAHLRDDGGYDAWLGPGWGVFRAEDIVPRAATRTLRNAHSETWLTLRLPHGWSGVTQYYGKAGRFRIRAAGRRFDQPSGWMVVGELGVRRETVLGTRVAVAGPVGEEVRRLDMLALLNWTLPELARLLPKLPDRVTIVSAGDPMWHGGLSAPKSLFVHASRPLLSENGTSTLLHEVMHLSLGLSAREGYDWVLEGLAEYYSLELLHRSGTITDSRYRHARADIAAWAKDATALCSPMSTGPTTALAVTVFGKIDREIRGKSRGTASLDDLTRALWRGGAPIDYPLLSETAESVAGGKLDTLRLENLPGCLAPGISPEAP